MLIRQATVEDADEIARLFTLLGHPATADSVRERWHSWEAEGNSALVVVRDEPALAGVATLHRTRVLHRPRPVGPLTGVVIDEDLRGQGIGRALIATAEQRLKQEGCGMVEVTSNMTRDRAHAFYERLGYTRTSFRFAKDV